jgi:hypothetical protein
VSNERYHCNQRKKGDPKGKEPNKGVTDGSGPKNIVLKNERYHENQGEERNPVGYNFLFTPAELYSGLNNIAVMKFPNS